jgi:hypothetical protein
MEKSSPLIPDVCPQDPSAMPRPTSQDLAGYWDMLQLSVEDVSMKFDELHQLKLSDWKTVESPERKVTTPRHATSVMARALPAGFKSSCSNGLRQAWCAGGSWPLASNAGPGLACTWTHVHKQVGWKSWAWEQPCPSRCVGGT